MTNYTTRITRLTVVPEGKPIFDESATYIEIDDEGAGEFVVIRQCNDSSENGAVAIDKNQWPSICMAVNELMEEVSDENP